MVTGNYRRSIVADVEIAGTRVLGQIGTNQPQGPRLEYGFTGMDVLGRNYNQPPFPHFLPSVPEIEAAVNERVNESLAEVIG